MEAQEKNADWYEDRLREAAASLNTTAIIVGLKMRGRFIERQEVSSKTENMNLNINTSLQALSDEQIDQLLAMLEGQQAEDQRQP